MLPNVALVPPFVKQLCHACCFLLRAPYGCLTLILLRARQSFPMFWPPRGSVPSRPRGRPPIVSAWHLSLHSPCGDRRVAGVNYPGSAGHVLPAIPSLEYEEEPELTEELFSLLEDDVAGFPRAILGPEPLPEAEILCFLRSSRRSPRDSLERALMSSSSFDTWTSF